MKPSCLADVSMWLLDNFGPINTLDVVYKTVMGVLHGML